MGGFFSRAAPNSRPWRLWKVVPTDAAHPEIILMPRDGPRRHRRDGERMIPTVATPGNFLMQPNEPRRQGEVGGK